MYTKTYIQYYQYHLLVNFDEIFGNIQYTNVAVVHMMVNMFSLSGTSFEQRSEHFKYSAHDNN